MDLESIRKNKGGMILQFSIPAIIAIAVSAFKLYKSIVKDRNKENIKIEIIRHTIFSLIMLLVLLLMVAIAEIGMDMAERES